MKKKLNITAITNELQGSVFFPKGSTEPQQKAVPSPAPDTTEQKMLQSPVDSVIPRHHETTIPVTHDTMIPNNEEEVLEVVRKAVKQIGKEGATQRLTLEEKQAIADIEYSYQRQGIRTSGNEIIRIALNYAVEEYRKNGENSILAKVLRRLNS